MHYNCKGDASAETTGKSPSGTKKRLGAAVFLDRDGVINREVNLLHRIEDFELIPGSAEAIKKMNDAGMKVIVVSNQAAVARGLCTESFIKKTHSLMIKLLAQKGARLDAVFFCPHHKNADLKKYRKLCPNRKPGTGFFKLAAEEFSLNLKKCFMVGDRQTDIVSGKNAGCKTILLDFGQEWAVGVRQAEPDFVCGSLAEAAEWILKGVKK